MFKKKVIIIEDQEDLRDSFELIINGMEIAIDDTTTAGYHDTGAIYDLAKPSENAMKPVGEWNQLELRCRGNNIRVTINGKVVTEMDCGEFTKPALRPDGAVPRAPAPRRRRSV